ncbi:MAG: hypothetical protein WCH20_00290 [Nitrospira sp.]
MGERPIRSGYRGCGRLSSQCEGLGGCHGFRRIGEVRMPRHRRETSAERSRREGVMATIDCLSQTGGKGLYLKQQLKDKLIEHKQCIDKHGQDLPEIRNWKWSRDGT